MQGQNLLTRSAGSPALPDSQRSIQPWKHHLSKTIWGLCLIINFRDIRLSIGVRVVV
jgi:hypothetical protein